MTTPYGGVQFHDRVIWNWAPLHTGAPTSNPLTVWLFSSELPPYPRGGLGRHVDRLARYLVHRGHQVRVVAPFPVLKGEPQESHGWHIETELPYEVWDVKDLPSGRHDDPPASIVHVHDPLLWSAAQDFAKRLEIPLIVTWHTLYGAWAYALSKVPDPEVTEEERTIMQKSPHQIWVSHSLQDEAERLYGPFDPGTRHSVIGSGISFPAINGAHLHRGFPDVLFWGRLEPEKGIDWLFAILPELLSRNPHIQVVICGNGSWRTTVRREIETHGWQHQVHAIGMVGDEELIQYLMTAKIAILPSRFEPFGLSALEALSAGVPTILGPARGLREFAIPDENCLVVEGPDALCLAIQRLLDNSDQRQQLADNAQTLAASWHWSRVGAKIEREYYRVLKLHNGNPAESW